MHPFSFLKPHIEWLDRAYQAVADDAEAQFSDAGWDKFWARLEMVIAAEASVRRGPNGNPELCIRGPKSRCPEDSAYTCSGCVKVSKLKSEGAAA